jgi:holliday junction DNA helicase RuvA
MIAALRGAVTRWDETTATAWMEVAGVTYEVRVPLYAAPWIASAIDLPETTLYTYYHVSERNPQPLLVGFRQLEERDFFRKFIEVPDVGPVKAVRALTYPVAEIARWIEAGDTKAIQQLPGIGVRLSQTIVAQLAGKVAAEAALAGDGTEAATAAGVASALRDDAVEALMALQYARREAERAVHDAIESRPEADTLEALVRAVLEQAARTQQPPRGREVA